MDVNADSGSTISLGNNNLIVGSSNSSFVIASPITGSGNLTKTGIFFYDLTAATGDTWSTTISEGGIQISSNTNLGSGPILFEPTTTSSTVGILDATVTGVVLANPIQIADGFTAQFQVDGGGLFSDLNLNGPITDITSGGNLEINSGNLRLANSGGNTYSGTTTIDSSAFLTTLADNVLSPNSPLVLNGELQNFTAFGHNNSIFSLSGSGILAVGSALTNTISIVGNSSTSFSGNFIDEGIVSLQGGGSLQYTGNDPFSEATFDVINSSNLIVDGNLGGQINVSSQGILSGTGTAQSVLIDTGGIISPGNSIGTLNVSFDYVQNPNSAYFVEIDMAGQSDLINVQGTAELNGGEVVVIPLDGINFAASYEILTAAGGLTGQFSGATLKNPVPGVLPVLDYSILDSVFLEFERVFLNGAISRNESQVQGQLNQLLLGSPNAAESAVLFALLAEPQDALTDSLDQLSGAQYTSDPFIVGLLGRQFIRKLYDPVRLLVVDPCYCPCCDEITLWAQGGWGRNFLRNDDNGFGFNTSGGDVTLGAQKTFCDLVTAGIGFSYDFESVRYNLNATGKMNSYFLGLYGLYRPEHFYILADAAFGYTQNKFKRQITVGDVVGIATSCPRFCDFTGYLELGFDLPICNLMIQPFAGVESNSYTRRQFRERNNSSFGLYVQRKNRTSATSRAGLHLTTQEEWCGFFLSADIAWDYRLTTVDNNLVERFLGFGTPFLIQGVPTSRNSIDGALTLSKFITQDLLSYIEAEGEVWNRSSSYNFQAGVQYSF